MKKLKGPKFIRKINARRYMKEELAKLSALSAELTDGRASEADLSYWESSLSNMKEYLEYINDGKEDYERFTEEYGWLEHRVRALKFEEHDVPYLIASSLLGLFHTLINQREKHESEGDLVVVMGNWMGFEGDKDSIYKAMDLIEEGVIVLRGRNEELYIEKNNKDSREVRFLKSLPTDIQTEELIVTTGNSQEEPVQMKEFIESGAPNLTGKTIVTVHPVEGESSTHDAERTIIMIAPGDAIKLNLNEAERNEMRHKEALARAKNDEKTKSVISDLSGMDKDILEELEELKKELADNMEHGQD